MLKEPRKEDFDFLTKLFSDPEVRRYANAVIALTEFSIHQGWWLVSRREDSEPLGLAHLGKYRNVRPDDAWGDDLQIDYEFAVSAWGHGYASEALNRLLGYAFGWLYRAELRRVLAWTRADNLRSQKLLLRLGFEHIGHCSDGAKIPQPCFLYKLTRERWMERQA